jgi:hypothetical protein
MYISGVRNVKDNYLIECVLGVSERGIDRQHEEVKDDDLRVARGRERIGRGKLGKNLDLYA